QLAPGGEVEIRFRLANSDELHTITIEAGKASLEDVIKAIIADSKLGVSATIMNEGVDTPHLLMLSSNKNGTENRITSISAQAAEGSSADVTTLQGLLAYDEPAPVEPGDGEGEVPAPTGMRQIVASADAKVVINGIEVTAQSNKLENVIDGVTLDLKK